MSVVSNCIISLFDESIFEPKAGCFEIEQKTWLRAVKKKS